MFKDDEEWNSIPIEQRFGCLWPAMVDLLKEMGAPFVLTIQLTQEDELHRRATAFHLVPGMDARIVFAAVLARDGVPGLSKMIPGLGPFTKMDMTNPDERRKFAEIEAGDMKMEHLALPIFMDSMRNPIEPPKEEKIDG